MRIRKYARAVIVNECHEILLQNLNFGCRRKRRVMGNAWRWRQGK